MNPTLEPLPLDDATLALLHAWVTHPRSSFWGMQGATPTEVARAHHALAATGHHDVWLGRVDGLPTFLAETYDPARSAASPLRDVAGLPPGVPAPGDLGMHVLVAPPDPDADPVPGLTRAVMAAVLDHCFADPAVQRVVVEPDVRNTAIGRLNAESGFVVLGEAALEDKTAAVSVLTRADHDRRRGRVPARTDPAAHLTPANLARAQRHLVAKALSELAHERVLRPEPLGDDRWRVVDPTGAVEHRFTATRLRLEHWALDEGSVERVVGGRSEPLDVQRLVVEHATALGLPDALLATYLEELAATLAGACWKLAHPGPDVDALLTADHLTVESAMTEGHPGFLANNGRIGFGVDDHRAYAPETGARVRLVWLAARRAHTTLALVDGLDEETLYAGELGAERDRLQRRLVDLDLDPADYLLLPVHPWQWTDKVAVTFAPDLARRDLVWLGEGSDEHRPQQSIRTLANATDPGRCFVKTALAVQNMGFVRGLSPAYMAMTPAINDHVAAIVEEDPELVTRGFTVLREVAAIGYTGDAYHHAGPRSAHQKMLAALWREPAAPRVAPGERLATMASLLHRDHDGRSFAVALVRSSPVDPRAWVRALLDAYVRPLAHCLLAHDLAFMPHGENLVLVLRDGVVARVVMKDVGEEVALMHDRPLPEPVERARADVGPDLGALSLHTDAVDGVLRHLAALLHTEGVVDQDDFWAEVAACLDRHATDHPELAAAATAYDLRRDTFRHSCLNRLQLRDHRQMVDLGDQASSLMWAGELENPFGRSRVAAAPPGVRAGGLRAGGLRAGGVGAAV